MKPTRDTFLNPTVALALCTAGGALFAWLRTPLPWMIGPLVVMAVFNFSGARVRPPPGGRQVGQVIIGADLGLGSLFTGMRALKRKFVKGTTVQ